jgi:hypothetical protein
MKMKNIIVILALLVISNYASAKSLTTKDGGLLKVGNWGGMCHVLFNMDNEPSMKALLTRESKYRGMTSHAIVNECIRVYPLFLEFQEVYKNEK